MYFQYYDYKYYGLKCWFAVFTKSLNTMCHKFIFDAGLSFISKRKICISYTLLEWWLWI